MAKNFWGSCSKNLELILIDEKVYGVTTDMGLDSERKDPKGKKSANVLLEFAYFIESEQTRERTNLLQRLAIIIAADATIIGLWANLLAGIIPRINDLIIIELMFLPLIILIFSFVYAALALLYKTFVSVDPDKIISDHYLTEEQENTMEEIASSLRRDWKENKEKAESRTRFFNISLSWLLLALVWIVIISIPIIFYAGGSNGR